MYFLLIVFHAAPVSVAVGPARGTQCAGHSVRDTVCGTHHTRTRGEPAHPAHAYKL